MKKILSLLLIIAIVFSLAACGQVSSNTIEYEEQTDGSRVNEEDHVYAEIEEMLVPIEKFVEYNHILGESINFNDMSSEDFWNIVAIVVSSYEKASDYGDVDEAGVYHLKWDTMLEFAKTFLFKTWYKNNAPSYKDSYSASADPGSGVIDLIPLGVDNYVISLESITKASDHANYEYALSLKLIPKEGTYKEIRYSVYLADWKEYLRDFYNIDDTAEHIMPFIVIGFQLEE